MDCIMCFYRGREEKNLSWASEEHYLTNFDLLSPSHPPSLCPNL